ncbi:hypothetical protein SH139x_001659 [Planctomycetaceae bacterium SH139]
MTIRRNFVLSLVATGVALVGSVVPAAGQSPTQGLAPMLDSPATQLSLQDGMITSLEGFELAPGETIIDGPPELKQLAETQMTPLPATDYAQGMAAACSPGCYVPCQPGYYSVVDMLYMQRTGGSGFTRAFGYSFDDYEWEFAPRVTWGRRFDCVDGYEFVFAGLLDWEDTIFGTTQDSVFIAPVLPANIFDAVQRFNNADRQFQSRRASYDSFEFSRTYTGWDVARIMVGLRGIMYDEDYAFGAEDTVTGDSVLLQQNTDNLLIGPQVGLQLFYPLGLRVYTDTTIKGAILLNFAESDTRLNVAAPTAVVLNSSADETELAGMIEIGSKLGINLTDSLSATIGYDFWYLSGLAEAGSQVSRNLSPATGFGINVDDDIFIHGVNAGLQFVY